MTTTSSHLNATDIPVPIEAYAPFVYQGETFQTYYKIFGDLTGHAVVPLIVIHGGPGLSHDYLLPHADLAVHRPVVFYDQIGNGRSTRLPNKPREFWTIDLFLDEFDSLVAHLGIQDAYHIVGHSWGGMMAAELVVRRHPASLKRLVVTNSPAAIDLWNKSLQQILGTFPKEVQDPVVKGESADPDGFFAAMLKVYAVHGLRIQPFPDEFLKTFGYQYGSNADKTVSNAGILNGWTVVERLHNVNVPTLTINGKYDIAQDFVMAAYHEKIPGAQWIKFENSSHLPCWEEREEYMKAIEAFLV